jgi:hypothetical protein
MGPRTGQGAISKRKLHVEIKFDIHTTLHPNSYNKTQRDALLLKFILVKNSTCFGQIYCPSSRVLILYSQQLVFFMLVPVAAPSKA